MSNSILADQDPDCWGALDFVDPANLKPRKRTMIIESWGKGKPPTGGKERIFFRFKGDPRKAFLKKSSRMNMALKLGTLDPDKMIGAALQITAMMAKNPKGVPPEVLSMTVIDAAFPPNTRQQAAPPTETPPTKEPEQQTSMREPGED